MTGLPSPPAPTTSTRAAANLGLAGASHLAQHDVAGVAFEFFIGKRHGGRS